MRATRRKLLRFAVRTLTQVTPFAILKSNAFPLRTVDVRLGAPADVGGQ